MTPEDRAWEVVRRAFEERRPAPRRFPASNSLLLALLLAAAVVVAAVLTPRGHAVFERMRRAVGVEHAAPALAALPAPGRLLVVAPARGDVWVVQADGAKRSLGTWRTASWSPHGLYVVAAAPDELAALTPTGDVRWTLARRRVAFPVWEGTRTDTRIAYVAGGRLRVVAGDGTGDHLLDAHPLALPPAWRPRASHVLAYAVRGAVVLRAADSGRTLWRRRLALRPSRLVWSSDGSQLAVVAAHAVVVLDARGRRVWSFPSPVRTIRGAAFRPGAHELALTSTRGGRSEVRLASRTSTRLLFAGPGAFGDIAWSPGGRWLLVDWPTADQWLFVSTGARPRVHAVANISRQFGRRLELAGGWCCGP